MEKLIQADPYLGIRLAVMLEMGILPTEPRVMNMSPVQWTLLYRFYNHKRRTDIDITKGILGVDMMGRDKMIPLVAFINPELTTKLLDGKQEEEAQEARMEKMTPEQQDEMMRSIYETDIDMVLTEEQKKKIADKDMAELLRVEKMAGIQEKK